MQGRRGERPRGGGGGGGKKRPSTPWLFTTRPGFERDLMEELSSGSRDLEAWVDGPSLIGTTARPARWPAFARAGFPVAFTVSADPEEIARTIVQPLDHLFRRQPKPWVLEVWVPDADQTNRLLPLATELEEQVAAIVDAQRPDLAKHRLAQPEDSIRRGGVIAGVCLAAKDRVLVGALLGHESPTLARGGRVRARMPKGSPSRAARKLVEAFDWLQRAPEAGEQVVDLGAAPGGWTTVLLNRRCRVIAVDPARLLPELMKNRALRHEPISAFEYEPEEPVDWLFCDMAWRPLEVASLLAKWGRRRWANSMIANIKLPMKQRAAFVERVLGIVSEGGWQDIRARQLYHDRFEVTIAAWHV